MAFSGSLSISATARLTRPQDQLLATPFDNLVYSVSQSFADGDGDDQADARWADRRTVSDIETLNLNDGSLTNAFNDAAEFEAVKLCVIKNRDTAESLLIGCSPDAPYAAWWGDVSAAYQYFEVPPGGCAVLCGPKDGYDCTGNKAKMQVAVAGYSSSGVQSIEYDIIVVGIAVGSSGA